MSLATIFQPLCLELSVLGTLIAYTLLISNLNCFIVHASYLPRCNSSKQVLQQIRLSYVSMQLVAALPPASSTMPCAYYWYYQNNNKSFHALLANIIPKIFCTNFQFAIVLSNLFLPTPNQGKTIHRSMMHLLPLCSYSISGLRRLKLNFLQ